MPSDNPWWYKYKVNVPIGKSGNWSIDRFEVTESQAEMSRIRARFSSSDRGRSVVAGLYTRLMCGSMIVMSDTNCEIQDHIDFIYKATGDVLIHGLGIGMVARACLMDINVRSVTVVEIEKDVIDLVGGWLKDFAKKNKTKLEIIHGDAFTWDVPKRVRWHAVWHDIWDSICGDNYEEMKRLHRRFGRRCDFQDSWCRGAVQKLNRGIR